MIRRALAVALLGLLFMSLSATGAIDDQNTTRGFAGKVYQFGNLDSVNVFNGNLTVRLPIGQTYVVGPGLKYQFMLTNNSKIWEYDLDIERKRISVPETDSDAGLGWTFSLGRLIPPDGGTNVHYWIYVGPDGSQREFSPHGAVSFTTDGSYLRLTQDASPNVHTVEFPDGMIQEFDTDGNLKLMRDRFGNWVHVAYGSVTCGELSCERWTITDGYGSLATGRSGRTHTVTFANKESKYYQESDNFHQVVRTVELAAFDLVANVTEKSTYTFHYSDDDTASGTTIPAKHCGADPNDQQNDQLAPLLTGVTLPDGSELVMEYVTDVAIDGACSVGSLKKLIMPTGGAIAWVYGDYEMTTQGCDDQNFWATSYGGVKKRSVYSNPQAAPEGVWTYSSVLGPPVQSGFIPNGWRCENGQWNFNMIYPPAEATTTAIGPSGKTVHYFSVYPSNAPSSATKFDGSEYGLPFSRNLELSEDSAATNKRALSSMIYDCVQSACATGGTLKQKTYVAYEHEGFYLSGPVNSRLWRQRVAYVGDDECGAGGNEECRVDTDYDGYDGYGHYRQTVMKSNFPSSVDRTSFTNYLPSTSPWIHNMYDESWVSEGSKARKALAVFDTTKGVLKSLRTLQSTNGTAAQLPELSSDLLSVSCRDARGFVTSERTFGGDLAGIPAAALPPNDPCAATRGTGHYFIKHTYGSSGTAIVSHTAQYDGTTHLIADETFDTHTGLVKSRRDAAGVETKFEYDTSGRLTAVKPDVEASTTYDYQLTSSPPALIARHCPTDLSTCESGSLTDSRYYYDGLGRMIEERRKMPPSATQASVWSALWTTYDALGRAKTKSVPVTTASGSSGTDVSTARTSWDYDFLGRVVKETRPDASSTTMTYSGVRTIARAVAGAGTTPQARSTEHYDGAGRLVGVTQPSGPTSVTTTTGADVSTVYTYDLADRLSSVSMTGTETTTAQVRTFAYDGRGFLSEESHPETGTIQYGEYDALGNVGKRLPAGEHSIFKHHYTYDSAGRLIQVDSGTPGWTAGATHIGEFRLLKKLVFATANTLTSKKKGKLEQATRENYGACRGVGCSGSWFRVTENYRYDSIGRTSGRTTIIDDVTREEPVLVKSIDQTFSYDALGLPSTASYPTCDGCGVPPVADPKREIALSRSQGLLQSVAGYVTAVTYGPSGTPTGVAHGNGMSDSLTLDSSGRPLSIAFGEWKSCGTPPAIGVQPVDEAIEWGTSATLEVTASGTSPQYQWFEASPATAIAGATQRQYTTPTLSATKSYFVRVSNACRTVQSATVTVTVTCFEPSITTPPQSREIGAGTSTALSVTATGTSLSYQWYRGVSGDTAQPVGTNAAGYTTPALSVTTSYWVRVSGACGTADSVTATLTVPLATPSNLRAALESSTSIRLTWSAVAGAAKYEVWRRSGAAPFALVTGEALSPWIDGQREWGKTYVYRVRAVDANNGSISGFSSSDLATVMSYAAIIPLTIIDDAYFHELLGALNALRAANGDAALTWTGILPAGVPAPAWNVLVLHEHLQALRPRFTAALQVFGIASAPYTNPDLVAEPLIRAVHVTELQQRAQ